MLLNKLQE